MLAPNVPRRLLKSLVPRLWHGQPQRLSEQSLACCAGSCPPAPPRTRVNERSWKARCAIGRAPRPTAFRTRVLSSPTVRFGQVVLARPAPGRRTAARGVAACGVDRLEALEALGTRPAAGASLCGT